MIAEPEGKGLSRGRAVVALLGIAAIAAGAWLLAPGDPSARLESAARRADWAEVVSRADITLARHPSDPRARSLRARGLARLGRSPEARAAYLALGAEEMTGDDFAALSDLLAADGRPALAVLALESALRLEPAGASLRAAMTERRSAIRNDGEAAHLVDHLAAVPGGPALGALVVSLAALATGDSSRDPLVDRLLTRDRESLRAIRSLGSARHLVARVLIEAGRPREALGLLNDAAPEARWLASRAHLQLGSIDEASAALASAEGFGADHSHEPDPALYVGARECRKCHPKEDAAEQSSRHATSIHHGADLAKIPLPDGPLADPADPRVVHRFAREGKAVRLETTVGDRTYRALMDYALGSGNHGITLIGKDDDGTYREARISQYSEDGLTWDVTSGFSPSPADPSEFLGKAFSASGVRDCIHCHVTRHRATTETPGPERLDRGIGCERCHGPGGNHVAAMKHGFDELAIAQYTDATGPERMSACSGCHASDGTFPPTDPQFVRFQSTTLPFSKCYVESKGKLDCVTCHDPHGNLVKTPGDYVETCLGCHAKGNDHESFLTVACPVSPSSGCLECHMPKVRDAVPHTTFTDHHIRVHPRGNGP